MSETNNVNNIIFTKPIPIKLKKSQLPVMQPLSIDYNFPEYTPEVSLALRAMALAKNPSNIDQTPNQESVDNSNLSTKEDYSSGVSELPALDDYNMRLFLIFAILKMLELTDLQDDGEINGSVYDDPEVAELLKSFGSLDTGENYDSIHNNIKSSQGEQRKNAINKMQKLHRKGLENNYDTYIDKKAGTNPDPKIGTVPGNKPSYINDSDWTKIKQLDPKMQAAVTTLYEKANARGLEFHISSGLRSHEAQERIYRNARPGYAAKPGSSQHELGNAIDIKASPETKRQLGQIWKNEMGLKWGQTFSKAPEDWHFDIRPA